MWKEEQEASLKEKIPSWKGSSCCLLLFAALCVFRLANVAVVQSYFDPDEFWQTLEPAYCAVVYPFRKTTVPTHDDDGDDDCPGYTWEWKRRASVTGHSSSRNFVTQSLWGPVRSYLSVVPTATYYYLLQRFRLPGNTNGEDDSRQEAQYQHLSNWLVARGPMLLQAVTVAAPIDLLVYYLGRRYYSTSTNAVSPSKDHRSKSSRSSNSSSNNPQHHYHCNLAVWCLFGSLTSWFHGYTLVRTLANSQESLCLLLAVVLCSAELLVRPSITTPAKRSRRTWYRAYGAMVLGGCSTAVRGTALTALVPLGLLLALRPPPPPPFFRSHPFRAFLAFLLGPCALGGLTGIGVAAVVDRYFYGFWTLPWLGNFHFNVVLHRASLYGTHPWHWYFTAGLPAVTGLLLPFGVYDLACCGYCCCCCTDDNDHNNYGRRNLWIIILSYLVAMSTNAHKEFRFLLPIVPLWCVVSATHVRTFFLGGTGGGTAGALRHGRRRRRYWLGTVWIAANAIAVLYLGLFHQSGPISVNREIVRRAILASTTEPHHTVHSHSPNILRIHYLTGACHSTPLHSHLHMASATRFETWHLDCSPECRAAGLRLCESEQFAANPRSFVRQAYHDDHYCHGIDDDDGNNNNSNDGDDDPLPPQQCVAASPSSRPRRPPPDYVMTFSAYVPALRDTLATQFSLHEVARFPHGLVGLQLRLPLWGQNNKVLTVGGQGLFGEERNTPYRRRTIVPGLLAVSLDEVVLFARSHPRSDTTTY